MVIKISKGRKGLPPPADQPADLLWMAEHGTDDDANVNQIAASVLLESAPTFVVGQWYSLAGVKLLFQGASGDPPDDVWTEIPVVAPSLSAKEPEPCPMQIRQYRAARIIFDSALQFAESLEGEGAAWIRVE
jgi:hypothetical protein